MTELPKHLKVYRPSIHIKTKNDVNNNTNTFLHCLSLNNMDHIAYFKQNFLFHDLKEPGNIYSNVHIKKCFRKIKNIHDPPQML